MSASDRMQCTAGIRRVKAPPQLNQGIDKFPETARSAAPSMSAQAVFSQCVWLGACLQQELGLGVRIISVTLLDGEPDRVGQRHVELVLVVAHWQLVILCHPTQHIHHLQKELSALHQPHAELVSAVAQRQLIADNPAAHASPARWGFSIHREGSAQGLHTRSTAPLSQDFMHVAASRAGCLILEEE